jgi:hypothetical protein
VLGHSHVEVLGSIASFTGGPDFGRHNAKGAIEYGHSFGPVNVLVSDLFKSSAWDQAYNIQLGWAPKEQDKWALSVGVQDITGTGGSAGEGFPLDDAKSSRSFFGAATFQANAGRHPVFITAGAGTRRFKNAFASVSSPIARYARLWAEYDGFGFNEGILLASKVGAGKRSAGLDLSIGYLKSRYFVLSTGIGF